MTAMCMCAQLCPTLWDSMDCSLPVSPVHGIFQARILEWVVISSSRESSRSGDWNCISCVSCLGRWILYHWATWEALEMPYDPAIPHLDIYLKQTNKNSSLKRYMHFNVHRSIIYNFQDMEANYMSINRWMVKENFCVISRQFADSHCSRCEVTVVWFGFLWWLEMLSIFSCACYISIYLHWKNAYSGLLCIF